MTQIQLTVLAPWITHRASNLPSQTDRYISRFVDCWLCKDQVVHEEFPFQTEMSLLTSPCCWLCEGDMFWFIWSVRQIQLTVQSWTDSEARSLSSRQISLRFVDCWLCERGRDLFLWSVTHIHSKVQRSAVSEDFPFRTDTFLVRYLGYWLWTGQVLFYVICYRFNSGS